MWRGGGVIDRYFNNDSSSWKYQRTFSRCQIPNTDGVGSSNPGRCRRSKVAQRLDGLKGGGGGDGGSEAPRAKRGPTETEGLFTSLFQFAYALRVMMRTKCMTSLHGNDK